MFKVLVLVLNFKLLNLYILLLVLVGCGVKSRPIAPPETEIPSYVDQFTKSSDGDEKAKDGDE